MVEARKGKIYFIANVQVFVILDRDRGKHLLTKKTSIIE